MAVYVVGVDRWSSSQTWHCCMYTASRCWGQTPSPIYLSVSFLLSAVGLLFSTTVHFIFHVHLFLFSHTHRPVICKQCKQQIHVTTRSVTITNRRESHFTVQWVGQCNRVNIRRSKVFPSVFWKSVTGGLNLTLFRLECYIIPLVARKDFLSQETRW